MPQAAYTLGGQGNDTYLAADVQSPRSPAATDLVAVDGMPYQYGRGWLNTTTSVRYVFQGSHGGWVIDESTTGTVLTLSGDSGTATPDGAGNIQIASGAGISTSASGHVVTITALGAGFTWNQVNSTIPANPVPMVIENGYITTDGTTRVTLKLPSTAPFGSTIKILGRGSAGWQLLQNAGQSIELQSSTTTVGVGGSVSSVLGTDSLELICTDSNTVWTATGPAGNLTFV